MARRRNRQEFQTIRSEGGLLPPDLLRRLIDPRSKLPGARPEDYALAARERLNEVVTWSWNRLRRHWTEFRTAAANLSAGEAGTGLTNDMWSLPLLRELGFGLLPAIAGPELGGRTYAIRRFFGPAPVHLLGCGLSLDRRTAGQRGAASANPHGLVQEFLNRSDAHLWAVVSNGLRLRILRDNQALSRQSWLEFDLEAMFSGEVYPDFVLLWLVAHATRFAPRDGDRPETCWLERWTREADRQGARALGELRGSVERALEILGAGFTGHPKNAALRETLRTGQIGLDDFHDQLLRVVYRLIFLFVAEDRRLDGQPLLHPRDDSDAARTARERYAAHYGAARLRDLAGRIKGSRHGDLWRQFQLLVGALSGDPGFETARRALALPALGSFLWDPASTAALDDAELTNHDFLETLRRLAFIRQGKALRPVDYRNLGAEELGGVYEGLLGLTPRLGGDSARFTFAEFAGNARKTSGSYYTPDALVQCLLDTALDPVVESAVRSKAGAEAERAILDLKICDPAAGSGHFLVGAAHRLVRHLARVRAHSAGDSEPSPLLHQHALRDVIGHCLYRVDRNPMAAELCRVSLWLEALEPGKPLSFLDHHIRVGNSLLGATPELIEAGLPDEAFNPIQGDDRNLCSGLRRKNRGEREDVQHVMDLMVAEPPGPEYGSIASLSRDIDESPDDTLDEVRRKAARFQRLIVSPRYRRRQRVADAWCAAFVQPKRAGGDPALCITTRTVRRLQADPGIDPGAGNGLDVDSDIGARTGYDTDADPGAGTGLDASPDTGARTRTGPDTDSDIGPDPGCDLDAGTGASPGADALSPAQRREVERLARRYRFFHWDLAFPEVFRERRLRLRARQPAAGAGEAPGYNSETDPSRRPFARKRHHVVGNGHFPTVGSLTTSPRPNRTLGPRILELTFTSWDLEPFANDCGYRGPPFRWDEERRFFLRCELDAAFFHLYLPADEHGDWRRARRSDGCPCDETSTELSELERHFPTPRDAVSYVMDTFPIVRRKDEEKFGEYRTKRVVLDIYDSIQVSIATGGTFRTVLDPPPAEPRCCHSPREHE